MVEAETARWPERAEECAGRVGEHTVNLRRAAEALSATTLLVREYRARLEECEATLRSAVPGCDLLACAAAREGVHVYSKALGEAQRETAAADEQYRGTLANQQREWSRAAKLIRMLTGKEPLEERMDRARLTMELQSLIGHGPQ